MAEAQRHKERKFIILGATGLLGKAIYNRFRETTCPENVIAIPWQDIGQSDIGGDRDRLAGFIEDRLGDIGRTDFILACGLIGNAEPERLRYSNLIFPQNLIQGIWRHPGARFMTFGTIHERFESAKSCNDYFMSKYLLSRWILEHSSKSPSKGRILHLRLHTLYGLPLNPQMFLGQMVQALKSGSVFRMSSGEQLREYHHAEDIAECVYRLCRMQWNIGPVLEINSGEAVRLKDLAESVFREFKREDLLRVGDISASEGENTSVRFERTDKTILPCSRKAIDGVLDTVRKELENA